MGRAAGVDTAVLGDRHRAGDPPHRLPDAAADMSGDEVVLTTSIAVLLVALVLGGLIAWGVWLIGGDQG